jgi:hypothetical protein
MSNEGYRWERGEHSWLFERAGSLISVFRDEELLVAGDKDGMGLLAHHLTCVATGRPRNTGKRWEETEDERVAEGHAASESAAALARELERSASAVKARWVHLGLEDDPGDLRFRVGPS